MYNQFIPALIFNEFSNENIIQDINQFMKKFLKGIPTHLGEESRDFFLGMFLGGLYEFEYSDQKKTLENNNDNIKTIFYYDKSGATLHLIFVINDTKRYLRSVMFLPEQKQKFRLPKRLKNLSFTSRSMIKIIYKKKLGFIWESPNLLNKINEVVADKAFATKIINDTPKNFILITKNLEINFENITEKYTESFGNENLITVKNALKSYLVASKEIYNLAESKIIEHYGNGFVEKNIFQLAFFFGKLSLVHWVNVCADSAIKGSFALAYRSSLANPNPYPIVIENDVGNLQISDIVGQIQQLYLTMGLPAQGCHSEAIISNLSIDKSNALDVNSVAIPSKKPNYR